jgi:hypothetical protein
VKPALRVLVSALAYCLVACSLAQNASAGTYAVYSCHFRDGQLAATDGWTVVQRQAGAQYDLSCIDGSGVGVSATGTRTYPRGYLTGIELIVPPDLRVSQFATQAQLWTSGAATWAWEAGYFGALAGATPWTTLNICSGTGCAGGETNDWRVIMRGHDLQSVALGIRCSVYQPSNCPSGTVAAVRTSAVELTLADAYQPRFTAPPTGTLLVRHATAKVRTLRYDVSDKGGGVREVVLEVDGSIAQRRAVDTTGDCRTPYDSIVPCPRTASGSFELDTSLSSPGKHSGRLLIFDASDGAPLEHRFEFWVTDPARPGASCLPDHTASVQLSQNPIAYGRKRLGFSVSGLPTPPQQAAVMDARRNSAVVGTAKMTDGRYVARLRADRPRFLRIAFPLSDGTFVCSQAVRLRVRAGLRLSIAPNVVSNGETIHLRGRLLGGTSARNRAVEVQARAKGGPRTWTLVRVLRTSSRGGFGMSYTFQRTFQRVRFEFRAVQRGGDGFPYERGASNPRMVLVKGR